MTAPEHDAPPATPFAGLTPDVILDAVEGLDYRCDGRLLALNSYENRVYQVGIEDGPPVIAKFYRAGRWPAAAILEEHAFARELAEFEIPVVAPLAANGATLHEYLDFRFALYPRRPGRAPEIDRPETLNWLGRFIARIHAVGEIRPFEHRPALGIERLGVEPSRWLLAHDFIPPDLRAAYESVIDDALARVRDGFGRAGDLAQLRLHGDCHLGNILWSEAGPCFVDLDDCMNGPAIQDLWLLLSGGRAEMEGQLAEVVDGYRDFMEFDPAGLHLVEALRTLRIIHYAAWLARRWDDPAFPLAFPWFNTQRYWQDHILALREQLAAMDEPPLAIAP
jgi:Ser/Thr protein kinase RdoA (MazF antagonist)